MWPILIADLTQPLHRVAMREPIGTTRKGQLLLGIVGLMIGVAGGLGLEERPKIFEPILEAVLYALGRTLGAHLHYDPSQRTFFVILLPSLGMFWALLFAYAFVREPARNRAIDVYLQRKNDLDQSRRATVVSQDDQSN